MTDVPAPSSNQSSPNAMSGDLQSIVGASRKARRYMVIAVLIYCAVLVGYITFVTRAETSNKILEDVVECSFTLCETVLAAYFATSVYQDRNYTPPSNPISLSSGEF